MFRIENKCAKGKRISSRGQQERTNEWKQKKEIVGLVEEEEERRVLEGRMNVGRGTTEKD